MLLAAFFPYAYGEAGHFGRYWAPNCVEFWLGTFYIGLVPVMLCLTAASRVILGERKSSFEIDDDPVSKMRTPFLLILLFVSLLYAMGGYTPFFITLWKTVPLLQWFRWPSKSLMCVVFALSCLSGIASDWLSRERGDTENDYPSGWRRLLSDWGGLLTWLALASFVGFCLVDDGRLGEWVLRKFFNLNSIAEKYSHRIPWPLLAGECLKFILVIITAAGLILVLRKGGTWRIPAMFTLLLLLFMDLFTTTLPLLPASDMDIMHNRGPYAQLIKTETGNGRFYRSVTQQYFYGVNNEKLIRLARDSMAASWPMVDEVHSIQPMGDFQLANYWDLLGIFQWETAPPQNALLVLRKIGCSAFLEPSL